MAFYDLWLGNRAGRILTALEVYGAGPRHKVHVISSLVDKLSCLYACDCVAIGTRLLTAGEVIQMWQSTDPTSGSVGGPSVEFYFDEQDNASGSVFTELICVWQSRPATPVTLIKFSSDSLLFATVGKVGLSSWIFD